MFPNSPLGPRRASSTEFCHQCRGTSSEQSFFVRTYVCMHVRMYICMFICIREVPFSDTVVSSDTLGGYLLRFF